MNYPFCIDTAGRSARPSSAGSTGAPPAGMPPVRASALCSGLPGRVDAGANWPTSSASLQPTPAPRGSVLLRELLDAGYPPA